MIKIKKLPKELRLLAIKNMQRERGYVDANRLLVSAFDWSETEQGWEFWNEASRGINEYVEVSDIEVRYEDVSIEERLASIDRKLQELIDKLKSNEKKRNSFN